MNVTVVFHRGPWVGGPPPRSGGSREDGNTDRDVESYRRRTWVEFTVCTLRNRSFFKCTTPTLRLRNKNQFFKHVETSWYSTYFCNFLFH